MNKFEKKIDYAKNKVAGEVKEGAGKITGNAQLELKGKVQSTKADLKKNLSIADKFEGMKENIAEGINDLMDKNKK